MDRLRSVIYDLVKRHQPMTVRQVYYQLVSRGVIAKTEGEYKSTVVRLLGEMRLNKDLPFGWIADATRWQKKPKTWSSAEFALKNTARTYRRALWNDQPDNVEIWLEKDALAGVLIEVTSEWDVPLMVTRGYPSLSFLHSAAESLDQKYTNGKPVPAYIYYFGDWDPSGLDIARTTEARLREFAPSAGIHFERVAVSEDQIDDWDLPTRPTKKTDTRSKGFKGESVEVDAIEPDELRDICRECIEQHIDDDALRKTKQVEQLERETLLQIANNFQTGAA